MSPVQSTSADAIAALYEHGIEAGLTTAQAAAAIGFQPQTLRRWAAFENGPIRPVRVGRRLVWPADGIRRLLRGETP